MTSDKSNRERKFEKATAAAQIASLLGMGSISSSQTPNVPADVSSPEYSEIQERENNVCDLEKQLEYQAGSQTYQHLPGIARLSSLTEQLDQAAELQAGHNKDKRERESEISLIESNQSESSGSPDSESEPGEYFSEYLKDIESGLEAGTLTLKSHEKTSQSESQGEFHAESQGESQSESQGESQAESQGESQTQSNSESRSESRSQSKGG